MPKPGKDGGKGKGKSGKSSKHKGSKGMQVDGDAAYVGQSGYDCYDHSSYYPQFAGDLVGREHQHSVAKLIFGYCF